MFGLKQPIQKRKASRGPGRIRFTSIRSDLCNLNNLNGTLVKTTLEMFDIHKLKDEIVAANFAKLLKNENRYIANQAYIS